MRVPSTIVLATLLCAAAAGCAPTTGSRVGDGAVVGGLAGAAIGGAASGTWGGAAIGAGVGAAAGAIIADQRGRCYWVDNHGRRHDTSCPRR